MTLDAAIATNRFGLGARAGELQAAQADPRGYLRKQLDAPIPERIRSLPDSALILERYATAFEQRRQTRKAEQDSPSPSSAPVMPPRQAIVPLYIEQVIARYLVAMQTSNSFHERLVHFWANHFAVSADKLQVLGLAGTLENEAIRPNLTRSFTDLLLAAESHPAMILYLDNQASVGPNSTLAQRAERRLRKNDRKFDINENLAREILELHTLGVDGGYTQADVTSFARALTGWSLGSGRGPFAEGTPGTFEFREIAHEPGAQTILGKRYSDDGADQVRAVLRDLANHPATATHIATKLVRHFVADTPSPASVDRVASVFRDTHGHLPSIHAALIDLPEAWAAEPRKLKTPHEFVIAAFRMLNFFPAQPQQIVATLQMLGQRPYTPGSPAGWPDVANQWDGPDALLKRIEWASEFGERVAKNHPPLEVADRALGASLSARSRQAIARAESSAQGLTLLLASPEFQRR